MHISLFGINHRTAPVNIRENIAISTNQLGDYLPLLNRYISNGIILSTCNRTEIYTIHSDEFNIEEAIMEFFKSHMNTSTDTDLSRYLYIHKDDSAIDHLFRVASGLDSMIIGEFEVLGQVKQALHAAGKAGMLNLPLRNMFEGAIRTGRRVRKDTGISQNALSVSSVAIDLVERVIPDLKKCKTLVIGAGEAGKLVAKAAKSRGASNIVVTSRSREKAAILANMLNGASSEMSNLSDELVTSHLVITCAGAPHRILSSNRINKIMENRPELPLVIIDIAVPRDVAPSVSQINNVYLYNIDHITQISNINLNQRSEEIENAVIIIATEVSRFTSWWQSFEVRPLVSALMKKAEDIRSAQLKKTLKKLNHLSDEERDNLEAMTKSIVTKILKDPIYCLKENKGYNENYADMINELFQLDMDRQE